MVFPYITSHELPLHDASLMPVSKYDEDDEAAIILKALKII